MRFLLVVTDFWVSTPALWDERAAGGAGGPATALRGAVAQRCASPEAPRPERSGIPGTPPKSPLRPHCWFAGPLPHFAAAYPEFRSALTKQRVSVCQHFRFTLIVFLLLFFFFFRRGQGTPPAASPEQTLVTTSFPAASAVALQRGRSSVGAEPPGGSSAPRSPARPAHRGVCLDLKQEREAGGAGTPAMRELNSALSQLWAPEGF